MESDRDSLRRYSRTTFLREALLLLPTCGLALGAHLARAAPARSQAPYRPLLIGRERLQQVRRNVFDLRLPSAVRAWTNTVRRADALLQHQPAPTHPDADLTDWRSTVYLPGLRDGGAALTLATAYAVGGKREYALKAKEICLSWARVYTPVPAQPRIGHLVAEPVGPIIKLCMAYDLARPIFSEREQAEFSSWAQVFVERGKRNADFARDRPWVADVVYDGDRTNVASYGNSATWQRAMAVWAAAAVGEDLLRSTLAWNFAHTTPAGYDYGWDDLLEGLIIAGSGGRVAEDRYRASIEYGHFAWYPLILIADLARNAGYARNLFAYRTRRSGATVFSPVAYYARYLTSTSVPDELERTQYGGEQWPTTAARWRAVYEILYRNASDASLVRLLHRIVSHNGPRQRGDNYDVYVIGYGALFGRGPRGPMPRPSRRSPSR